MAEDDKQRSALEEFYRSLTPDERRERFFLRPAYRTARDRILDSEDRTTLPRYALSKWLPVLGAEAFALWLLMRDMSRVEAARADSWCWPEQNDLAARVAVSKNTLRKLLAVLEHHGFIRSERRRERVDGRWGMMQRTNRYEVFVDVPLVQADAIEALMSDVLQEAFRPEFKICTQGHGPVDDPLSSNSALRAAELTNCTQGSEGFHEVSSAEFKTCTLNVSNENNPSNVREIPSRKIPLREHPAVKPLSGVEKRERARLASEIGETLHRMSGIRDGGAHLSLGFHRLVAFLMPVNLVHEALRATRDAVDDRRSGRGGVRQDPSQYFGGIVKQLAREHAIDLGLKTCPPRQPSSHHPKPRATAPSAEFEQSPEERARTKQQMRELIDGLAAKLASRALT